MKNLTIIFAFLLLFGCSKDNTSEEEISDQQNSEVADNVVVILEENSSLLSSETEISNGIYKIEFTNGAPAINSNNIIVGDEGQGFLRKVSSISSNGNTLTMQTSQATIDDVFNDANIEFNTNITRNSDTPNPIKQSIVINYIHDGVRMNENGLEYDFSNTVLLDDGIGTFTITNGNATFDPNFNFKADYSFFGGLDFLEFKADNANLVINCDLDVTIGGALNLPEFSQTLIDYDKYLTFLVAGVPVVVVVNTQLVAKLNANVDTNVTWLSSWTNTFGVTTGVKYENDNWTGTFDLNSHLALNSMNFSGRVNLAQNLTITPRASLKFYGIFGPYCQPELTEDYAFNVASPSLDWDAELKAGLNLTTGVDVTIFGNTLADFSSTDSFEESIWNTPEMLEIVSGNNQIGNQGQQLAEAIKVKVTENLGNPMPFVPVYFSVTEGNGSVDNESVMTDSDGFAEVLWTLGDNTDLQSVEATVKKADGSNIIGAPVTFNANSNGSIDLLSILTTGLWNFSPDQWLVSQSCYDASGNLIFTDTGYNGGPGFIMFNGDYSIDVPNCFCILSNNTFSINGNSVNLTITAEYGSYGNTFNWSFNGTYDEAMGVFVGSGITNSTTYHPNGEIECDYIGSASGMNLQ